MCGWVCIRSEDAYLCTLELSMDLHTLNLGHYKLHSWFPSRIQFPKHAGGRDGSDIIN